MTRIVSRIGSEWVESDTEVLIDNPANTDEIVARAVFADASVADAAVEVARMGFAQWRRIPLMDRSPLAISRP